VIVCAARSQGCHGDVTCVWRPRPPLRGRVWADPCTPWTRRTVGAVRRPLITTLGLAFLLGSLSGRIAWMRESGACAARLPPGELGLTVRLLEPADRSVGFGLFYSCFYVLMAAGPFVAGRLQDAWGSPSAALVASAALLASMVPLVALFLLVARRREFVQPDHETKLRTAS